MGKRDIAKELECFKNLLYSDEDAVLTKDQFIPLQRLMTSLATDGSLALHLSRLLPLSLKLFDHHDVDLKLVGVECVDLIISNVPLDHLARSGTDLLLMDSLSKSLYNPDSRFFIRVVPLILEAAKVFKLPPDKLEQLFLQFHEQISLTDDINKKASLWTAVSPLLTLLGLHTVKFVTHYLMVIISDQLSYPLVVIRDGKTDTEDNVVTLFSETIQSMITMMEVVPREVLQRHVKSCILLLAKFIFSNSSFFADADDLNRTAVSILLKKRLSRALSLLSSFDRDNYEKCLHVLLDEIDKISKEEISNTEVLEKLSSKKRTLETVLSTFEKD